MKRPDKRTSDPPPTGAALAVSVPPGWGPTPGLVRALAALLISVSDRRERAAKERLRREG
jgi:hypothetical protein